MTTVHRDNDVRIFQKECVTLAGHGYDISLVAAGGKNRTESGVKIVGVSKGKSRLSRLFTGWRVFRAAMALNPDICHFHDPDILLWAQVMRVMGKVVIYDMHENNPKSILAKPWIPPFLRKATSVSYKCVERMLAHKIEVVFPGADFVECFPWVSDGVVLLNLPLVDHLLAVDAQKLPEPTIAYLGAVSIDRGALNTVEALGILAKRGVRVKWLCIGPPNKGVTAEIDRVAKEHGIIDQVEMVGYLHPKQAWEMIAGCWCGMAVLLPAPNYVNAYPTKIFEYMALGMPVITSDFPLYKEVIDGCECGLCVNSADPEAIADAIQKVVSNPDTQTEMGARGKEAVQSKYNWNSQAEKLLALYARLEKQIKKDKK